MNRLSKLICLCALGALAASCTVDELPWIREDKAILKIHIKTPAPAVPATRTYGIDNDIVGVWVLALKQTSGGTYVYQYKVQGEAIEQGSSSTASFTVVLRQSDNPVKLMVVTNCPDDFADGIVPGTSEDDLRLAMTCGFDDLADKMPMAGDVVLTSLSAGQNSASVSLLRTVGRVQVTVDPAVTNFDMKKVYVYRPNSKVQIAAILDNIDTSNATAPKVTAASVPLGSTPYGTPMEKDVSGSMASTDYFYVPESAPASSSMELMNTTNCIVVGGYYNGATDKLSYYRIDFNSGLKGHPLGQVLRNHGYQFTIKGVSVDGEGSPDTAATELAGSLNVGIVAWDDSATDVYIPSTNDYISTSSRTLTLPYEEGTSETLIITSTMPFTMSFSGEEGELSSAAADSGAVSIDGTLFSYVLLRTKYDTTASPPASTYTLTVTAKANNDPETNADAISIAVGGGTLGVSIAQSTQPTYVAPVTLTVLTLDESTYGGLGTNTGKPGGGSMDMLRAMLDNTNGIGYFGPSGKVKLDQILYQESASTNFDNDNDAATFGVAIQDVDVIIMPGFSLGASLPTAANCQKILDWLKNPAHILIMSIDANDSNTKMRTALDGYLPYTFASMGWVSDDNNTPLLNKLTDVSPTGFSVSGTAYGSAPSTSRMGDDVFLGTDAPFGAADPSGFFKTADGIWEYSTGDLPIYVLPLVDVALDGTPSGGNRGYYHTGAMLAAVDTRYGIVWMGEPQMWGSSYGGMNTTGKDPLSILTANLWAWILEQTNPS